MINISKHSQCAQLIAKFDETNYNCYFINNESLTFCKFAKLIVSNILWAVFVYSLIIFPIFTILSHVVHFVIAGSFIFEVVNFNDGLLSVKIFSFILVLGSMEIILATYFILLHTISINLIKIHDYFKYKNDKSVSHKFLKIFIRSKKQKFCPTVNITE